MGNPKGQKGTNKNKSLDKKIINDLEEIFKLNTDNENQEEHIEDPWVKVAVNEFYHMEYDREEDVVIAMGNALVDGHGEDCETLAILSPRQINQLFHFCEMAIHKQKFDKLSR
jgi:hypothetical protein